MNPYQANFEISQKRTSLIGPGVTGRQERPWMAALSMALLVAVSSALGADAKAPGDQDAASGWKLLFDGKTTQGWRSFKKQSFPEAGWIVEDGWLHCLGKGGGNKGGGDVITDAEFGDFELSWEWKQATDGNSGLKYFVLETRNAALGHEYQMIDDARNGDAKLAQGKRVTAAFYDVLKPTVAPPTRPPGQTNESRVLIRGNHVEHWLNGTKVLEYECGSPELKDALAHSKFKDTPGFGNKVKGHLLLQDHDSEVWFRNIKIREIAE
jgi:hypothetical protein